MIFIMTVTEEGARDVFELCDSGVCVVPKNERDRDLRRVVMPNRYHDRIIARRIAPRVVMLDKRGEHDIDIAPIRVIIGASPNNGGLGVAVEDIWEEKDIDTLARVRRTA